MRILTKPLKLIIGLSALAVIIASIWIVSQPKITIALDVERHDPIRTTVIINGKAVSPRGAGGKTYVSKLRYGKNELMIKSPFTKDYVTEISATPFKSSLMNIEPEKRSPEDIIAQTTSAEKIEFSNLRVFEDASSIVAYIVRDGVVNSDSYPSLFVYNFSTGQWGEISNEYIENRENFILSPEVIKYFSELTSD